MFLEQKRTIIRCHFLLRCVLVPCASSHIAEERTVSQMFNHIFSFFSLLSFSCWSWWDISKLHNSKCFWQTPRKSNKFVKAVELICDQIFHSPAFISFVFHSYPSLISLFALPFSCSAASSLVVDVVLDVLFFSCCCSSRSGFWRFVGDICAQSAEVYRVDWDMGMLWNVILPSDLFGSSKTKGEREEKWKTWNDKRNKFI